MDGADHRERACIHFSLSVLPPIVGFRSGLAAILERKINSALPRVVHVIVGTEWQEAIMDRGARSKSSDKLAATLAGGVSRKNKTL